MRTLLAVALVAVLLPATPSAGTPPGVQVRAIDLEFGAGRSPLSLDWKVVDVADVGHAVMVGADWGGDPSVLVEVRTVTAGVTGEWTRLVLPVDGPDSDSGEGRRARMSSSDPVWIGAVDSLQVRTRGSRIVRIHAIDAIGGDGLAYTPAGRGGGTALTLAAATKPAILSRASWGADESMRSYTPRYADRVRFAAVHHTAGSNSYSAEESDDVVRAIYAYHTQVRGWDDIAYNFLVDRFGTVYEGRAGGIGKTVIGAHAAGWNDGSTGVAVMGSFNSAEPSQQAVAALDELLAWKLDVHHIDPRGTTVEVAGGGSSNLHERYEQVELPTIIGHRTTNATSCPGDLLYAQLDAMRDRVEAIGLPKAYGGPPLVREQPRIGIRPRWDVAFTEPLNWRLVVRDAKDEIVRSTGGAAATEVALAWDLLDADGRWVAPGEYVVELTAWSGNRKARSVTTRFEVTDPVDRHAGDDRVHTAVLLSEWAFPSASRVVLASSEDFADALSASPLAGSFGSPVLLVPNGPVPKMVMDEIERLASDEVYIVGGPARIPDSAIGELAALPRIDGDGVHRLAGADRFATSAVVAQRVIDREGSTEILLALGRHENPDKAFADALSAGAFGASLQVPVALVDQNGLPGPIAELLSRQSWPDGVTVFGGPAAISDEIVEAAASASGGVVTRIAGQDRYETATLALDELRARWAAIVEERGADPTIESTGLEVLLASGQNWPDALGAAAAAARRGSVFSLVHPDGLAGSEVVRSWLEKNAQSLVHAVLAGGPQAVAADVVGQVQQAIASAGPHKEPKPKWVPDPWLPPDPAPDPSPSIPVPSLPPIP